MLLYNPYDLIIIEENVIPPENIEELMLALKELEDVNWIQFSVVFTQAMTSLETIAERPNKKGYFTGLHLSQEEVDIFRKVITYLAVI